MITGMWKPVVGYEGLYEVSDLGQIRSLVRKRIRKLASTRDGYCVVGLWKNKSVKLKPVHRIVLEAFIGPCPAGMESRHFPDNSRSNNQIANLSWATKAVNSADKKYHGTVHRPSGITNGCAKIDEDGARKVSTLRDSGRTQQEIANIVGISRTQVRNILTGRKWSHIKQWVPFGR